MYSNQQQKADFLTSLMGKGILLLSLSMIKYSWYIVMKTNFENARPVLSSSRALAASQPEEEVPEGEEEGKDAGDVGEAP